MTSTKRTKLAIGVVLAMLWPGAVGTALAEEPPRFQVSPVAFDFGDVHLGTSEVRVVHVTNRGDGPETISMAGGAAGPFGGVQNCQGRTLDPGESCQITYTFSPSELGEVTGSTGGTVNGQVFAFDFRGNGVEVFRLSRTSIDFGAVRVGSGHAQSIDVTNIAAEPVTVSMAGGAAGPFGGVQNCQGKTLGPGESCQITYTFSPSEVGEVTGSTGGTINGQPFAFTFRGEGIRQFDLSGTALDFGSVAVGSSRAQSIHVTNAGTEDVTVSMAGGAAGPFGGVQNCQGRTLGPGESCQITYTFSPSEVGEVTASTSGSINGQGFAFDFRGEGHDPAAPPSPSFEISPTRFDFGDVHLGGQRQRVVTVTNRGGEPETISMAGGAAGPFGGVQNCQGRTLDPGESCQITYTFSPSEVGEVTASTSGSVNGQGFAFQFRGTGVPAFAFVGPSLDFGPVPVGSSVSQAVQVVNMGDAPVVGAMTGGAAGEFGGVQNCQGRTIASGESCQITYTFSPSEVGEVTASTGGTMNGQPFAFTFRGEGIRQFDLSATALDLGPVAIGSSRSQSIDVTNVGTSPVTVSMAGGAAGEFGGVQNCQGRTLDPGESCQITYTFSPTVPGPATASTSGSINGQPFAFVLHGHGVGDITPPVITAHVDPPSPDGDNGWYRTPPTVSFSIDDPESDVVAQDGCAPQVVDVDTTPDGVTLTCTATSEGGTASESVTILRDGTAPTVACPADARFLVGEVGEVVATVTDAHSGPVSDTVSAAADTSSAGVREVDLTGRDVAGNTTTVTCTYVVGFLLEPFLRPVPDQEVRAGAAVPVIFQLRDASGQPIPDTDAQALADACAVRIDFSGGGVDQDCVRYEPDDDQFVFPLKTPKGASGRHTIDVEVMVDGQVVASGSIDIVLTQ